MTKWSCSSKLKRLSKKNGQPFFVFSTCSQAVDRLEILDGNLIMESLKTLLLFRGTCRPAFAGRDFEVSFRDCHKGTCGKIGKSCKIFYTADCGVR